MENLPRFMAYAADFEKTLLDDDWSRLRQYFADDAVYVVDAKSFACKLTGPDAIFQGMKKSLDGFDRKFQGRNVQVTSGPEMDGDTMRMSWELTYRKEGKTPYLLRGKTAVRYRDGKIVHLADSYGPEVDAEAAVWMQQNGITLDPSYV
jgi:ketosteroid isomerase-like protein